MTENENTNLDIDTPMIGYYVKQKWKFTDAQINQIHPEMSRSIFPPVQEDMLSAAQK